MSTWRWTSNARSILILQGILILAASVLVNGASVKYGFNWDDDYHVTSNPCVAGPWGIGHIWTSSNANFFPFVLTTLRLEFLAWGAKPSLFHFVNLLFHSLDGILLWMVLKEVKVRWAFLGALLWTIHPVQSESAEWISEQKNTESAFFYLIAIYCFLKWLAKGKEGSMPLYLATFIFSLLALTSKTSTVMLPVLMSVLAWWMGTRVDKRVLSALTPFYLLSVAAGILTVLEQKYHVGAVGHEYTLSLIERLGLSGMTPWFYLAKLLTPWTVCFIYPKWDHESLVLAGLALLPVNLLGVTGLIMFRGISVCRVVLFATLCFVIPLLPVMGFFDGYFFRYSYVSDHFQYLASMAPLALLGAGLGTLAHSDSKGRGPRSVMAVCISILVLILLIWVNISLTPRFLDRKALWTDTLKRNPNCWMAMNNLGLLELSAGRTDAAERFFQSAIRIHPNDEGDWNNLGVLNMDRGDFVTAKKNLEKALEINPKESKILDNIARLNLLQGKEGEAMSWFTRAVNANELNSKAVCHLSALLIKMGQSNEAQAILEKTARVVPRDPKLHLLLASILYSKGQFTESLRENQNALFLDPSDQEANHNLARLEMGSDPMKAKNRLLSLLKQFPQDVDAWNLLALILLSVGDNGAATQSLQRSVDLSPAQPEALRYLALLAASEANYNKALDLASKAAAFAKAQSNTELITLLSEDLAKFQKREKIEIHFSNQ